MEWAVENNEVKGDFILQDFVKGIELSTEVWFSRGRPVTPSNGTMEAKKFMAGDIGPNTGCMGSVVWPYPVAEPRIVQQTLKKLYAPLAAIEYSGPLDVNCIVDEKGQSYFLEFTARFGYSAIYALCEILEMPLSELLFKAADGDLDKMDLKSEFGLAGTVAIPPYPLDPDDPQDVWEFKETAGKAIKGVPLGHSWFLDAEKGKKGELVTAGIEGLILNVTASGPQLSNAQKMLYERIEEVNLADKMYRNDLADRAMKQLPKLRAMNYQVPDPVTFYGQKKKVMAAV
jgi:phosphoribosylamine--glycine ligase